MPAEDQERHWAEGLDRLAMVAATAVATVAFIYWLFVYWCLGNEQIVWLEVLVDGDWKQVFRLTIASIGTVILLGSEVILFRWWFRR